jgi:hypothetical protein
MGKYVMVAQSQSKEGRDEEYNRWYDTTHLSDICALPGVRSARRFEATPFHVGQAGLRYLAIYEIETDDPAALMGEMRKRAAVGTMKSCDALDVKTAILWLYKFREPTG